MTATKTTMSTVTPVGERTDKELQNRINALERQIETRQTEQAELLKAINERIIERDALLDEQMRRLDARKSQPSVVDLGELKGGEQ